MFCLAVSAAVTDIPFDPERGLVEVEVVLDGRVQGTFGIDTGADGFYIDRDFALSNHLRLKEEPSQYSVVSIEGGSDVHAVSIRSLQIGHDRLFNLSAAAIDMSALNLDPAIEHPDGLLGHDILRRFYVTIDYPDQTMRLETMQPSFLRTDSYYSIPFKIYGHFIVVEVTFDEQTTVPMAVDYCASHTVITPELAERLDLSSDLGKIHTIPEMKLTREVVSTDVISAVSDLTSVLKLVPRSRIQGILGATFLHSHRLTVDYRRQMIYIHQD
jgi:predicted aspartyl protease